MCGIAGLFGLRERRDDELVTLVERMTAAIVHRGPDDSGTWAEAGAAIALGFRRLAIIDLSANGHQPMSSASGRFTMVFNGEIYNHAALRRTLRAHGHSFRGHSDTEVALAAFEQWGVTDALPLFVGMFAVAVWDAGDRTLYLARDRMGKKPLFVTAQSGYVAFASELKALRTLPGFDATLDRDAAAEFLRYLYVPGPRSIYRRVRKLEPGHLLTIRDPNADLPGAEPFWSLDDAAAAGERAPFGGDDADAVNELERLLGDAVQARMCADVPLGAFLSGGIDSSTVAALMQASSMSPVRTFSVAFDAAEHNEAPFAAAVAAHLGTEHTEILLTGRDALDIVPRLSAIYDEPFADASQIPTYLICREARRHVTVVLSGDGGDEVFGGYNRYVHGERMIANLRRVPRSARRMIAAGIASVGTNGWDRAYRALSPVMPGRMRHRLPGQKLHRLGRLMAEESEAEMYRALVSQWGEREEIVLGAHASHDAIERTIEGRVPPGLLSRMMLADQSSYLVEDQMSKVDRASMAVSLEIRVPILDHRVIEFAWRLPEHMKVRNGIGKWVLRQVLYRYVPRALVEREKMGFSVPVGPWLRGPLRDWAEALIGPRQLADDDLLAHAPIARAWTRVLRGDDQAALGIWAVLMLQQWRARWA